ncbi:MAG: TolC family protein [Sphingobacterium sp.]|nr:TolC family protein [Sphingobacterium sp.]
MRVCIDSEEVNVKLSHAPEKTLEQHNDHKEDLYIKIVDRQLELQEKKIKLARSNYFPRLTFNGSYGSNYSSQRQNDIYNETTSFWSQINQNRTLYGNFSLSIPLFDGLITKNNINSAQISKHSLFYEKEKQIVERNQVRKQALLEYKASKEELNALELACEANKISYNAINERYKIGKSSSINLYKAMTDYNISEYKLITSRYKVFYQKTFLEITGY